MIRRVYLKYKSLKWYIFVNNNLELWLKYIQQRFLWRYKKLNRALTITWIIEHRYRQVHSGFFYKDHSTIAYIIITQEFDLHIWKIFYDDLFNNCEAILNKMHCKIEPLSHYVTVKLIVLSIFNSIGDGRSLDWLKDYALWISHFLLLPFVFSLSQCIAQRSKHFTLNKK